MRIFAVIAFLFVCQQVAAQIKEKIEFEKLDALDTISEEKRNSDFNEPLTIENGNVLLSINKKEDSASLLEKNKASWVVYQLPGDIDDLNYFEQNGSFVLFRDRRGGSSKNSNWSTENQYILNLKNHSYIQIERLIEFQDWNDPPKKRHNESDEHYEARIDREQKTTTTSCDCKINLSDKILKIKTVCKTSVYQNHRTWHLKHPKVISGDTDGVYEYHDGAFYRLKQIRRKSFKYH